MSLADPRRNVPRTDAVLADPRLQDATQRLGRPAVKRAVSAVLEQVRAGTLPPDAAADVAVACLPELPATITPVINATGVVLHTNLGRAPLSDVAVAALRAAAGYVDVEYDLATGQRAQRGRGALATLRDSVPGAEDVLIVNNGAAALVLATTVLARGKEVIVSRGEMIEIGDGFRLPELIESTGARLRAVGATNRVTPADYADAVGADTGCILKVHPSNFRIEGFTSAVAVRELALLGPPVVVDIGSGLLAVDPLLPDEPVAAVALRDGAGLVTCSGDKLLGGPQAGLLLGVGALVERMRRHPLARALRVDKLTLAALEATLAGPVTPTWTYLRADAAALRARCDALAAAVRDAVRAEVVPCESAVGGGGAPGVRLPSWAVALPAEFAARLRIGTPAVVGRIEHDRCVLDLRCVPEPDDDRVAEAIRRCT
ncbi:MAG TPA: L-seryl-tRNA(Sec) selenium transferase [Jatrophihabitantaceae bacterium]|nr:L-seryl-tRNA(Sec) selenium transferase [Jatrophihabitantaceae bacterium]